MLRKMFHPAPALLALLSVGVCVGCDGRPATEEAPPPPIERDLAAIDEAGELTMLTMTNATSYFIYRGEIMGFEYELLRKFAESRGLTLRVEVVEDRSELLRRLDRGQGDVIASQVTASSDLGERAALTSPLYRTRATVVQADAAPEDADLAEPVDRVLREGPPAVPGDSGEGTGTTGPAATGHTVEIPARLIRQPKSLAGNRVFVPDRTATLDRLVELEDRIAGDIHIVEVGGEQSYEHLIRRVAEGAIGLAAAPEAIARLDEAYFSNIVVQPTFGPAIEVVWAVRDTSPNLRAALDEWLAAHRDGAEWRELEYKYFVDRHGYRERRTSEYLTSSTAQLSEYDALFRKHAERLGWDWRLLASQAYQESRFDPRARSWAGASGLLQLMPRTARAYGVHDPLVPEENIRAAVAHLEWLKGYWSDRIEDPRERIRFVLASYNAGHGHVQDARRLAEKYGDDADRWEDVSYWLLQKSKRRYFTDPVVRFGFARGLEPVTYVAYVLERFEHYRRFVEA